MLRISASSLPALFIAISTQVSSAFADVPDIERQIASSCGNSAASKLTVERLPFELARYRAETEALEEQSSVFMQQKGKTLRQRKQWSDSAEETFFRQLVSGDAFQNYERQRNKITQAYMKMTEAVLDAVLQQEYDKACKASVFMGMFMRELHAVTENQWRFMLAEKDSALAKAELAVRSDPNKEPQRNAPAARPQTGGQ